MTKFHFSLTFKKHKSLATNASYGGFETIEQVKEAWNFGRVAIAMQTQVE